MVGLILWGVIFVWFYFTFLTVNYRISIDDYLTGGQKYIQSVDGVRNEFIYTSNASNALKYKDIDSAKYIIQNFGGRQHSKFNIEKRLFGSVYKNVYTEGQYDSNNLLKTQNQNPIDNDFYNLLENNRREIQTQYSNLVRRIQESTIEYIYLPNAYLKAMELISNGDNRDLITLYYQYRMKVENKICSKCDYSLSKEIIKIEDHIPLEVSNDNYSQPLSQVLVVFYSIGPMLDEFANLLEFLGLCKSIRNLFEPGVEDLKDTSLFWQDSLLIATSLPSEYNFRSNKGFNGEYLSNDEIELKFSQVLTLQTEVKEILTNVSSSLDQLTKIWNLMKEINESSSEEFEEFISE
ncbi:hypothetical protein [Streptococcus uberis]|uniref:hypothetical protein n=1 Tax=Streptococcus uberis TaxID=1349 RepID=UPI001FF34E1B|nr:hypothetical protein [Streptococcus uberis]MCK1157638.1 hypothetical protein [Streptococcus uberis]MCK1250933.1 hypothetical protein [Streptococcus uberis]